jgi:hypothetical protein
MEPIIALIEPMRVALTQLQAEVTTLQIQNAAEAQVILHIPLKPKKFVIAGALDEEGSFDWQYHSVCAGWW